MNRIKLSAEERLAIEAMRAAKAAIKADYDFQRKAIATAYAFSKWSNRTKEGLTFSTFVNTFGYQNEDTKQMYAAVCRIFESAKPASY